VCVWHLLTSAQVAITYQYTLDRQLHMYSHN